MKRKYEVIGIVIDTEKEAEKCSFLSSFLPPCTYMPESSSVPEATHLPARTFSWTKFRHTDQPSVKPAQFFTLSAYHTVFARTVMLLLGGILLFMADCPFAVPACYTNKVFLPFRTMPKRRLNDSLLQQHPGQKRNIFRQYSFLQCNAGELDTTTGRCSMDFSPSQHGILRNNTPGYTR